MKSSEMDLVKIEWIDAMSDDNTWQEIKELKAQKLRPVEFVGWILTSRPGKSYHHLFL